MSRIIVTGGSGFIGTNLIEALRQGGHELLNLDRQAPRCEAHRGLWQAVDITDAAALTAAVSAFRPQFIYHLAARTDMHGTALSEYGANIGGVDNMIAAAAACESLQRIIFASSRMVCRIGYQPQSSTDYQPSTPYGESKVVGEQHVRAAALRCEWTLARPTSIWGPWFGVPYRDFFDAVRHGRYIHPKGARIRKSFGYVGNTVHQLQQLMAAPAAAIQGQTFYLADYEPIEVRAWGETIRQAFGARPIHDVPLSLLRTLARIGDGLSRVGWKNVPLTSFRLDNLLTQMLYDTAPLQAVCGPLPYTVEQGVARTVEWMRQGREAP